jgi:hypothetical protein
MDKVFAISDVGIDFPHTVRLKNIPPINETDLYFYVILIRGKKAKPEKLLIKRIFFEILSAFKVLSLG